MRSTCANLPIYTGFQHILIKINKACLDMLSIIAFCFPINEGIMQDLSLNLTANFNFPI